MSVIKKSAINLTWLTTFCIAMAYLESAVVVYLRMIYYPEGFQFPLQFIPMNIYIIEIGREFATIVMLAVVGYLSGKSFIEKFSYFIFSFGIWDIFYYIWLKVFLNWPSSLFDDDILFLIPVPWVGPVIAPIIISLTFIVAAVWIIRHKERSYDLTVGKKHLFLFGTGNILMLISFVWNFFSTNLYQDPDPGFRWELFIIGELILLAGLFLLRKDNKKVQE